MNKVLRSALPVVAAGLIFAAIYALGYHHGFRGGRAWPSNPDTAAVADAGETPAAALYDEADSMHENMGGNDAGNINIETQFVDFQGMYLRLVDAHVAAIHQDDSLIFKKSVAGLIGLEIMMERMRPEIKGVPDGGSEALPHQDGTNAAQLYERALAGVDQTPDDAGGVTLPRVSGHQWPRMYRLAAEAHVTAFHENNPYIWQQSLMLMIATDEAVIKAKPGLAKEEL